MSLPALITRVDEDRPLLELLPDLPDDERFAFVSEGEGTVGWGIAARIAVGTGAERFTRARDGLAAAFGDVESTRAEDGAPAPRAFASFAFDESDDSSVMVVPATTFVRRRGITWRISIGDPHGLEPATSVTRTTSPDRPRYAGPTLRDDVWLDAVAHAIEDIDAGLYEKVVLARDLHLWSRDDFPTTGVLRRLALEFPSSTTFLVDHLLGASPELLIRRDRDRITSRVLAGTAARGANASEDQRVGAELLRSPKDRHEHDLALASAVDALTGACAVLGVDERPTLLRLANVQHLASTLNGRLRTTDRGEHHILELVDRLHPTAAVGGTPRADALDAIRSLEGMSRGRYAGPVGWCTADGDGEFVIALRCAEIHGNRARLFAGAGVVAGSLPEAELTETWLKLRAMTGVLDPSVATGPS